MPGEAGPGFVPPAIQCWYPCEVAAGGRRLYQPVPSCEWLLTNAYSDTRPYATDAFRAAAGMPVLFALTPGIFKRNDVRAKSGFGSLADTLIAHNAVK